MQNGPHGNKFTPERAQKLLAGISVGATRVLACKYAGIDLDTLNRWERRHPDFAAQMREAEGNAVLKWLAVIDRAALQDNVWQAAAWKLERRYPEQYGRTLQEQHRRQIEFTPEQLAVLSDAELAALYARLSLPSEPGSAGDRAPAQSEGTGEPGG